MSNPCRLDDTTQNKVAYAMGFEDGRVDAIEEFADWLVKYKVIPNGAMQELIRDFNGEMGKEQK